MGCDLKISQDSIVVSATDNLKPVRIQTQGYPGFPTDLQQPITTLLTKCKGLSVVDETIYENRFNNVKFLNKMGSSIIIGGRKIYISGPSKLYGKTVEATDLRAGACMILAALSAEGITTITSIEHVLRGYENIIEKLQSVGAKIELEDI